MFKYFSDQPTSKFKVLRKIIIDECKGKLMLSIQKQR
ncbi:hypothetical protein D0416_04045 [Staphylococcus epidermidis]|nr:hypothetical protein F9B42_07585 [Staphylococcus epidermidis]MBM0766695.1 hypothetical protein [Staphylococcus epidermidis]MBM0778217.1 hypothetical protein [Staphylococcus epidermidis]MBM0800028.1 hypothetical protein [Staphylococcus epidermidis]MBM0808883.1 hypothetical protein [Staphylococcus epidermidis]